MSPTEVLRSGSGLLMAIGCVFVGSLFFALMLAPRLAWPANYREAPDEPESQPNWHWLWLILLPPSIILFQFVILPLRWIGVPPSLWLAFGTSIASGLAGVALAWWLLCRREGRPVRALGVRWPRLGLQLVQLPVFAYPVALSLMLLSVLFQVAVLRRPAPPMQASMKAVMSIASPSLKVLAIVAITVVAPIAEELLFRGVLFRGLRFRWGVVPAMVVSAAVFAAAHLDLDHTLPIFSLGLLLAFVAEESRSILPGIVLHALVNGMALFLVWKLPG